MFSAHGSFSNSQFQKELQDEIDEIKKDRASNIATNNQTEDNPKTPKISSKITDKIVLDKHNDSIMVNVSDKNKNE